MSTPQSHPSVTVRLDTLFRSDLIHVFDYRCTGHSQADAKDEIPQGHEIVLPRAGAYQRRDVHGSFLADPNHVLFYNQGEPYDISHPIQGGDSSTVFLFAPALLIEMIRTYNPDVENHPHRVFQRSHITFEARLQILQYRLLHLKRHEVEPLAMDETILTFVSEILHALHGQQPVVKKQLSRNTRRAHADQTHVIKTFLNAHVRSQLQLEQISSGVHLSPYHLCRVFKGNTGMTLHQYVRRLRLFNAAEQMLQEPHARLDLLALEYGFSNHGNFSTAFRQTFGVNPSELRNDQLRQMSKILKA
jgi:AraC family transcriptional regulator